uniref:Uncharacterized protein n=1 Tax=Photinus pyralis TaxID=7054 RepID=A0A1Y1K307_PHOPY
MSLAVAELVKQGAVIQCSNTNVKDQFLSKIFLADKPNGKKRFILNLKPLNNIISSPHFKMENFETVSRLLQVNHPIQTPFDETCINIAGKETGPEHRHNSQICGLVRKVTNLRQVLRQTCAANTELYKYNH